MADLFVDGEWREAVAGGHREIRCPADGTPVATVSEGTRADTEAAIGNFPVAGFLVIVPLGTSTCVESSVFEFGVTITLPSELIQ